MPCQALRNIPKNKLDIEINELEKIDDKHTRMILKKVYHRYFEANIPIKYWGLEMNKHFNGDVNALNFYKELISDIDALYKRGKLVCFAGNYGRGKTMLVTNLLKRSLEKGYSGLYVTLTDIVSAVRSNESFIARKELFNVDFLVIDEFDPRYMPTDAASDFYGRVLEDVLRNRSQNKMPIYFCTNAGEPNKVFKGALHESISSLFNYVDVFYVLGSDKRAEEGCHG